MIIAHFKETPIAHAPEAISDVINKYTDHKSYVFGYGYPNKKLIPKTDILHLHNKDRNYNFNKKVIQYHSEPFRVTLDVKTKKLVIAQYHATLPEYNNCTVVRNPIDIYDVKFLPKYQNKKIRIGYSPSTVRPLSIWADKGYTETYPILQKIKSKYGNSVEIDIIVNVSLDECLKRKSLCNIFIDEVKTISYHRSGLESLSMGIPTICSIGPSVEKLLLNSSGAPNSPFINVNHNQLEKKLIELINLGVGNLLEIGYNNRLWMEKYWSPDTIANEYIEIYKKI
jgi:hypothetical protein